MKFLFLFATLILTIFNNLESTRAEDENKIKDFCNLCLCDKDIIPMLISCEKLHLTSLFSEEEWNYMIQNQKINVTTAIFDVRFDENDLEEITRFPILPIERLSFRGNRLKAIEPSAFGNLEQLTSLDLSNNKFTAKDIPEDVFFGNNNITFYKPLNLQSLNLSNNNIHSFVTDLFDHFPYLTSLDLSYNPIRILGGATSIAIADLQSLEYLSLANTGISDIPAGMIHALLNLLALDLSGNEFSTVPDELRNAHNLSVLILDDNRFESFNADSFSGLDSLTELSISNMKSLRLIEGKTFGAMKKLIKFYCHHNRNLDRISNAAFYEIAEKPEEWPIKEIYLNDNALTHIDKALAAWEVTPYIDIQNNPFRCNCDLKWMSGVLVDQIRRTHPHLAQNVICSEPKQLKGASIIELGLEPESFANCREGVYELSGLRILINNESGYTNRQNAAVTVLVVGAILIVLALSIIGVIIIKRRAIAAALDTHQEIRYQRADNEDSEHPVSYKTPASAYRY